MTPWGSYEGSIAMYLTRLELDTRRRSTMKALASPNLFHGAIESSFPGERKRRLWRIDPLNGRYYLLLLSEDAPDLTDMARQFGVSGAALPWESKSYDSLLERIQEGSTWQFRLTANPTKACKSAASPQARGTVHAHITPAHQQQWLLERCQSHGFSLNSEEFLVTSSRWLRFYKGQARKYPVTLLSCTYEGLLTVTDAQQFRQTLQTGIGRGKAYGLGLLTIVRPRG